MVPLIVVQPVFIDVMQERSDIMPFGPVKTPVFDFPPRFAAFEGLFGLPRFPSNLTPILMVQDVLDNIGVFSFLEMNDLELVFLETYPSFPSNNPKMYPKGDHTRRRQHTQHSTKSRE